MSTNETPTLQSEFKNVIPLDLLIASNVNNYELTCSIIKRAHQIAITGDDELDKNHGKVVSLAIKQVLSRQVGYEILD